jgi:hypothetical protein
MKWRFSVSLKHNRIVNLNLSVKLDSRNDRLLVNWLFSVNCAESRCVVSAIVSVRGWVSRSLLHRSLLQWRAQYLRILSLAQSSSSIFKYRRNQHTHITNSYCHLNFQWEEE